MGDEKEKPEKAARSGDASHAWAPPLLESPLIGTVRVVPFDRAHIPALAEVLVTVREQNPDYPPALYATDTQESLTGWLDDDEPLDRWTILVDDVPAGHSMLVGTHAYIEDHLADSDSDVRASDTVELSKVFVAPGYRHHGLGRALVQHSLDAVRGLGKVPVLAVLATSPEAIRLYPRLGMRNRGFFHGQSGVNWVFTGGGVPSFDEGAPVARRWQIRRTDAPELLSKRDDLTPAQEQLLTEIYAWISTRRRRS